MCHRLNYNRSVLDVIRLLRSSLDDKQDQSSSTRSLSVAAQAELTFTYIKHLLENVARDKLNRLEINIQDLMYLTAQNCYHNVIKLLKACGIICILVNTIHVQRNIATLFRC